MPDITQISSKLHRASDDVWYSTEHSEIFYPDQANQWCNAVEDASYWFVHRNRMIINTLRLFPPQGWLADIGGGNGFVAQAMQQAGFEVVLIEPGKDGIRMARERGIQQIIGATIQDAGVNPGVIPAVGLFDMVEHIQDDVAFIKDIRRMLVPGGRCYLTVPAYPVLHSFDDKYIGHFHRYTRKSMHSLIEKAGMTLEYFTYFLAALPLPIFFSKTLPYRLGLSKKFNVDRFQRQIKPSSTSLNELMLTLSNWEVKSLQQKKPIWFGASLLAVACK